MPAANKGKTPVQHHPPICASIELELSDLQNEFSFYPEYILNSKPNSIDILIEKKDAKKRIANGIGSFWDKYNLVELKSRRDSLGARIFHRTLGYANLFMAYNRDVRSTSELTVTFIRQAKPIAMMKYMKKKGYVFHEHEKGIYRGKKSGEIPVQIIVTRLLSKKYKWLSKLSDNVEWKDVEELIEEIGKLTDERDLLNAESFMDLIIKMNYNKSWIKELTGCDRFPKGSFQEPENTQVRISGN